MHFLASSAQSHVSVVVKYSSEKFDFVISVCDHILPKRITDLGLQKS